MVKPEGAFPEKYIKRLHKFARSRGLGSSDYGVGCKMSAFGLGRSRSGQWLFASKVSLYHPVCAVSPFEC